MTWSKYLVDSIKVPRWQREDAVSSLKYSKNEMMKVKGPFSQFYFTGSSERVFVKINRLISKNAITMLSACSR